jgi:hypothetical protein
LAAIAEKMRAIPQKAVSRQITATSSCQRPQNGQRRTPEQLAVDTTWFEKEKVRNEQVCMSRLKPQA